jgi:diguanylate cyclase (GGDEF)-like protein
VVWLFGVIRLEKLSNCYGSNIPWNITIRFALFGIVIYLISALKNAYNEQKELAQIDELTKALNRRSFLELLEKEFQRSSRYKYSFTLAYFDVDNFKMVNDTYGHSRGDRLLQLVAKQAKISIRSIDIFARLGGDEFGLLLLETDYETARKVLQRLQQQLMSAIKLENFPVSFSIGAITFRNLPESSERMIEQVDNLMYQVKNEGKNGLKHELS